MNIVDNFLENMRVKQNLPPTGTMYLKINLYFVTTTASGSAKRKRYILSIFTVLLESHFAFTLASEFYDWKIFAKKS